MSTTLNFVNLRAGSTADLAIVDTIMQAAFDPRFGEAWTRSQCLGILSLPGVWLTIASTNDEPAGFALSRVIVDEAELLLLATAPDKRRRGVGAALLRSVIADCCIRSAKTLHLEVREGNPAINLYRDAGFIKVGERRQYYRGPGGHVLDAFTFRRELG